MGNIQDNCCNSDKDHNTILSQSPNKSQKTEKVQSQPIAEARKANKNGQGEANKSTSNFSDQAF